MDAILVVLRPKQHSTVSQDFHPKAYDVLLTEFPVPGNKTLKQLPKTTISFEEEPVDVLCTFLFNLTGAAFGGLKGKRAVFVPPARNEPVGDADSINSVKGPLYCVPVDSKDTLNPEFVNDLRTIPGFYSLDLVLDNLNNKPLSFVKQTRIMLHRLDVWLREKHNVPGAVDLLFSVCAEDRLKVSITNPAYLTDHPSGIGGTLGHVVSRTTANEALAKMMAIEKCDVTIINPLFGSDMSYKTKVEAVEVNKYWGLGRPDYSKVSIPIPQRITQGGSSVAWVEEFPVHKCAYEGDADGIRALINKGSSVTKIDRDFWAPIHYAAWFGHLEAISVLLNDGDCSPNLTNDNGSTPLHLAASKGRVYVIELLLNHPEIDVSMLDKCNKTALDLCDDVTKPDCQAAAQLLRSAMSKPTPTIQVYLMDGTFRMLNLVSRANTTVQQLHTQMMAELDVPDSCAHVFTIWICSRNLHLQLKPDHKPIQHLNDWKRKIVQILTDVNPSREDPQLFWRRDAILSHVEERKIKNTTVINLLFHEAYQNYIKSSYPCADHDAIILGGVLMQLNQGDYEARKAANYFANDPSLQTLVPTTKQRNRRVDWATKVQAQYKHYSQSMAHRDRSPQCIQQHFLTICWNLTVYGSAFFKGYVQIRTSRSPTPVSLGVNDIGIHVITAHTKSMLQSFRYKDIDWSLRDNQSVLEIKLKGNNKGGMCIMTRQAGPIYHLTLRLKWLREQRDIMDQLEQQQAQRVQQRVLEKRQEDRTRQQQAEQKQGNQVKLFQSKLKQLFSVKPPQPPVAKETHSEPHVTNIAREVYSPDVAAGGGVGIGHRAPLPVGEVPKSRKKPAGIPKSVSMPSIAMATNQEGAALPPAAVGSKRTILTPQSRRKFVTVGSPPLAAPKVTTGSHPFGGGWRSGAVADPGKRGKPGVRDAKAGRPKRKTGNRHRPEDAEERFALPPDYSDAGSDDSAADGENTYEYVYNNDTLVLGHGGNQQSDI